MRLVLATTTALLALTPAVTTGAGGEPAGGTFTNDPVALLIRNDQVPGKEEFAVDHGNFRYLFATAESRDAFQADPARYEIQLGGACARMGALSSCADPDRYAVHDGKLYIFASDGCRAGFLKDPASVLEPVSDPAPTGTPDQTARGKMLIEKCVAWMGGADRLDAMTTLEFRGDTDVDVKGAKVHQIEATTLRLPDMIRTDYVWDGTDWIKTGHSSDAFFIDRGAQLRPMHAHQAAIFRRELARHIPVIMRARVGPDFIACAQGVRKGAAGETVAVHFAGTLTELIIDPDTGRLVGWRCLDWGPKGRLGEVERLYTTYTQVGGVQLPATWTASFNGERAESLDQSQARSIRANFDLPAGFFTREAGPISPERPTPAG